MGYDLSLTVPVMHDVDVPLDGMTYNINRLLAETRWVGLKLRDLNGFTCAEVAMVLNDVLTDWVNDPMRYIIIQVPDWGSLANCTKWGLQMLKVCRKYPDAILEVS